MTYAGWKIYFTRSGSNCRLRSVKASHPAAAHRLELVQGEQFSRADAIKAMKQEIDNFSQGSTGIRQVTRTVGCQRNR